MLLRLLSHNGRLSVAKVVQMVAVVCDFFLALTSGNTVSSRGMCTYACCCCLLVLGVIVVGCASPSRIRQKQEGGSSGGSSSRGWGGLIELTMYSFIKAIGKDLEYRDGRWW
jgi:hypothetical protein